MTYEEQRKKWRDAGGNGSQCQGCGEVFNSVCAFDAHRTGIGKDRRCMSLEEMQAADFRTNKYRRWVVGKMPEGVWGRKPDVDMPIADGACG